jgi:hypothetical protein
MTWWRQVVHVLRRDALASWWLYLGFLVVVAVRTTTAFFVSPLYEFEGSSVLVLVIAVAAIAMRLVMGDPPERAGALWGTLPLAGSAVAAAKLFTLVSIVLLTVAAEVVSLGQFSVSPMNALTTSTSGIGTLTGLVLLVATLTALTTSAWAVVALSLVVPVVSLLAKSTITSVLWRSSGSASAGVPLWMTWVGFSVGVLFLWWAYLRNPNRRRRVFAGAGSLLAVAIAWMFSLDRPALPAMATGAVEGQRPLVIIRSRIESNEEKQISVSVMVASAELSLGDRSRLANFSASLQFPDGSSVPQFNRSPFEQAVRSVTALRAPRPALRGVRRWTDQAAWSVDTVNMHFAFSLTTAQRRLLNQGEARVTLVGQLEESRPAEVARASAGAVHTIRLPGRLIDLRPSGDAIVPGVRVRTLAVGEHDYGNEGVLIASANTTPTSLIAVHRSTGEARYLRSVNGWGTQSGGLVLPATPLLRSNTVWAVSGSGEVGPDADWFANAEIVFVEWKAARRFAVRASAPITVGGTSVVALR